MNASSSKSIKRTLDKDIPEITNIRKLSYANVGDEVLYSANKWKFPKDEIFDKLGALVPDSQIKIADFLNLFYYFIICYSKTCFKKNGNWNSPRWKHRYNWHTINNSVLFRYDLANQIESHQQLLDIQNRMYQYRQEYENVIYGKRKYNYSSVNTNAYFTNAKRTEILEFVDESIGKLCTDIKEPVVLVSQDIKEKIAKYVHQYKNANSNKTKNKKSPKINYDILAEICKDKGIDIANISNISN
jgi:hypothetical protein